MEKRNFKLWKAWIQSPPVLVVVGEEKEEVLVPRQLLRSRSPFFHSAIDEKSCWKEPESIFLRDVEPVAFDRFLSWSFREEPYIPDDITQEELEGLAAFAEKYQVFALQHQVADKFNDGLNDGFGSRKWNLQPNMVSRVYQKCCPQSCLRKVFQEALDMVAPERMLNEWSEWSQLAASGGDLGMDLLKAVAERSNAQSRNLYWHLEPVRRSSDPCRFHSHLRQGLPIKIKRGMKEFGDKKCPFRGVECFPSEVTKEENQEVSEVKSTKEQVWDEGLAEEVPPQEEGPMPEEPSMLEEPSMPEEVPAQDGEPMSEEVPAQDEEPMPEEPMSEEVPAQDEEPMPEEPSMPEEVPAQDEGLMPEEPPVPPGPAGQEDGWITVGQRRLGN